MSVGELYKIVQVLKFARNRDIDPGVACRLVHRGLVRHPAACHSWGQSILSWLGTTHFCAFTTSIKPDTLFVVSSALAAPWSRPTDRVGTTRKMPLIGRAVAFVPSCLQHFHTSNHASDHPRKAFVMNQRALDEQLPAFQEVGRRQYSTLLVCCGFLLAGREVQRQH